MLRTTNIPYHNNQLYNSIRHTYGINKQPATNGIKWKTVVIQALLLAICCTIHLLLHHYPTIYNTYIPSALHRQSIMLATTTIIDILFIILCSTMDTQYDLGVFSLMCILVIVHSFLCLYDLEILKKKYYDIELLYIITTVIYIILVLLKIIPNLLKNIIYITITIVSIYLWCRHLPEQYKNLLQLST